MIESLRYDSSSRFISVRNAYGSLFFISLSAIISMLLALSISSFLLFNLLYEIKAIIFVTIKRIKITSPSRIKLIESVTFPILDNAKSVGIEILCKMNI